MVLGHLQKGCHQYVLGGSFFAFYPAVSYKGLELLELLLEYSARYRLLLESAWLEGGCDSLASCGQDRRGFEATRVGGTEVGEDATAHRAKRAGGTAHPAGGSGIHCTRLPFEASSAVSIAREGRAPNLRALAEAQNDQEQ